MTERGKRNLQRWIYFSGGLSVVLCLSVYATRFLIEQPLCCADNVYIAISAKNYANENGYRSSFPGNAYHQADPSSRAFAKLPFDPGVTTGGPSQWLSVPLQRAFPGNLYAFDAAGIITRAIALLILLALWPMKNLRGLALYGFLAWSLISVAHLTHATIFTNIGEMTAALFLTTGVAAFCKGAQEHRRILLLLSVLLFWLAYLTKMNSVVFLGIFLGGAGTWLAVNGERRRLLELAAFGIFLLVSSEFFLLIHLGIDGYLVQKQTTLFLISIVENYSKAGGRIAFPQIQSLYQPLLLGFAFATLLWALARLQPRRDGLLLAWSIISALLYFALNTGLGNRNPRYLVLPISTLLMLGIYALTSWHHLRFETISFQRAFGNYVLSLIVVFALLLSGESPLWMVKNAMRQPIPSSNRGDHARAYATYLDSIKDTPVAVYSWQNAVDAEWLSTRTPGWIQDYQQIDREQPFYILFDKRWNNSKPLSAFVAEECAESFSRGPYSVWRCQN